MAGAQTLRAKQTEMSRDLILGTVVDVLEKDGLDGVSMPAIDSVAAATGHRNKPRCDRLERMGERERRGTPWKRPRSIG